MNDIWKSLLRRSFRKGWVVVLSIFLVPSLARGAITVTNLTSPYALQDSNLATAGPHVLLFVEQVTNTSTTIPVTNLTTTLSFTGGASLSFVPGESATRTLGSLATSTSITFYWFVEYPNSATSASSTFTYQFQTTTSEGDNVTTSGSLSRVSAIASSNQTIPKASFSGVAILGNTISEIVDIDFGNVNSSTNQLRAELVGPAGAPFNAAILRLVSATISFNLGNTLPTYTNVLYFDNDKPSPTPQFPAAVTANSGNVHATSTFIWKIVGVGSTTLRPYEGSAGSSAGFKYNGDYDTRLTDTSPTSTNTLTVSTSASPSAVAPSGTTTVTIMVSNASQLASADLDQIIDTLPSGATYVSGSASYNGVPIPDPVTVGSQLIWNGPFTVPADGSSMLTFQVRMPPTEGIYVISAIAKVGDTQVDVTTDTTDAAPATAGVIVSNSCP